jgi:amino acid transporter
VGGTSTSELRRHFGLLQATALNVTMVVGAGVFVTIPPMLKQLPGPWAVLGWVVAGGVMLVDGLIWAELGATLPGSGGTYLYLLESYGRERWGRLMAFLFIWQFLISGPLELGSGLIAIATFSSGLSERFQAFDNHWTASLTLWESQELAVYLAPSRLLALLLGLVIIILAYRRITFLSRVTVTLWLGVLGVSAWILIEGGRHFAWPGALDFSGHEATWPEDGWQRLGAAMRLAMYSYLGYYTVCYIGDEVREPGRTIPRSIILSALLVCLLFVGLHLAMLGTVPWETIPTTDKEIANYSLPAAFMERIYGPGSWTVKLVTVLLIWSCFGSAFAGLLGYSRIPYGAARYGHFFAALGRIHPRLAIPHVSLLLVGGLMLFWSFFGLQMVIDAMITTRIIEQFIGQIIGVVLLRRRDPVRFRPYKMWLYPLPCGLALVGWLFMYTTAPGLFIGLGMGTLLAGAAVFLLWARTSRGWPFQPDAPQGLPPLPKPPR